MDQLIYQTGFGIISKQLMCNPNLSSNAKSLFAYFAAYAGNGDTAFPSVKLIMYHLNWSKDKFYKYRKELEEKGYLNIEQIKQKGMFSHNIYRLNAIPIGNTIKSPCPDFPDTVKPDTVKPDTENQDTIINSINKNSINKNSIDIKKNKKETNFDKIINEYTSNSDLKETIYDFMRMRKTIKAPMTDRALKLLLTKLDGLEEKDAKKIEILNQSIENSWRGVFPINQTKTKSDNSISKNNANMQVKTRFHNINETFRNYSPDELEKLLLESQKGKFK